MNTKHSFFAIKSLLVWSLLSLSCVAFAHVASDSKINPNVKSSQCVSSEDLDNRQREIQDKTEQLELKERQLNIRQAHLEGEEKRLAHDQKLEEALEKSFVQRQHELVNKEQDLEQEREKLHPELKPATIPAGRFAPYQYNVSGGS
jgi:TolA-binding protein